ncbi:MAG: GHMP kinase [Flavobacteriales bacterium]|nr:GHMP kinase [Flavobacteriales bacterium]
MSEVRYYSNGKLLISGEYAVLDGAEALAVPTKFGQDLVVSKNESQKIVWKSYDVDGIMWYADTFSIAQVLSEDKHPNPITQTLWDILRVAHQLNSSVLHPTNGFEVSTHLTFSRKWGLGTSSTLINNIAQWFRIDAFELLQKSFGGSGYDIACAQTDSPIFYQVKSQRVLFNRVDFNPSFKDQLFFVYLNQKRNSKEAIRSYREHQVGVKEIQQVTSYTRKIYEASTLREFEDLINQHEAFLSDLLRTQTIKEELFLDYQGSIKSLGAWGGDFVLVTGQENEVKKYFNDKHYHVVISYDEMVL